MKGSGGGADSNLLPSAGLQFCGLVDIAGAREPMTCASWIATTGNSGHHA
ncbi:hypothetical protein J2Y48_000867 [Mycoplana sp. BE70]|nr:hypothetical protein [Mycoplana sp. BE70]